MPNQTIYADAQVAKCNVLSIDHEITQLIEYGLDCGLNKSEEERSRLGGLIWLAESGCLDSKEECKVQKQLNRKLLSALCSTDTTESCDRFIKCDTVTIEIDDVDDCELPKDVTITIE